MTVLRTGDGPVEVTFDFDGGDGGGWPTVRATTWDAAAFGLGWACARQRSGQLDLLRRRAHGRLAELLGPAAVPGDIRQRTLGLAAVADRCWELLPAGQRRMLEFHADGVAAAGADIEPWRPVDTVAVAQVLYQSLGSDGADNRMVEVLRRTLPAEVVTFLLDPADEFGTELDGAESAAVPAPLPLAALRTLVAQPPESPARVVVSDGRPVGSNAWATARDGVVVLANDMHLELTEPSLLHPARVILPESTVEGVLLPGVPAIVAGATERIAWGFTRLPADGCDLYEIEEDDTGDGYFVDGHIEPYTVRREVIRVRGAEDVVLPVRETRWGPVTDRLAGRPVAFAGTLTEPGALDFGLAGMHAARTAHEAADLLAGCGMAPVNALLADTAGTVLWTVAGRFPARSSTGPRGFATPGTVAGPPGWLPQSALPRRVAPPGGFLVSCNNGNVESRSAGLGWNFFPGCRARRAAAALAAGDAPGAAGSARLQLDVDAGYFAFYRDLALRYLDSVRPSVRPAELTTLRAEVAAWRGTAHRDEYGLALLVAFRDVLREEVFAALTRPCQRYDERFTYCYHGYERPLRRVLGALGDGLVPAPWRGPAHFVLGQLGMARALLTRHTGIAGPVRWGEVNRLALTTGPAAVELSGCAESLLVAQPDFGAAVRLVAELTAPGGRELSVPGAPGGAAPAVTHRRLTRWAATEPLSPALSGRLP